jgi:hypothetical protein
MNLQENIERIHEIMGGVIYENKKDMIINKTINELGLFNTFKFFGGYDDFLKLNPDYIISKEDKIRFIKDTVSYLMEAMDDEYVNLEAYDEEPILVSESDGFIRQIEVLEMGGAGTSLYEKSTDAWIQDDTIPYEKIGDEPLNDVFLFLLEIMERD